MSHVLSEEKKLQVIALGKLGWSLRRIEQETGVRRETAGGYLKAAGIVIQPPCWRRRSSAKSAIQVATDFIRPVLEKTPIPLPASSQPESVCEAFRETIQLGLSRGRNAMAIWQDLVSGQGISGADNTVKRFVSRLRGSTQPEAVGIIVTGPGEETQVDYGDGPMVRDPQTGKYRRTLFVMTLYSAIFGSFRQTSGRIRATLARKTSDSVGSFTQEVP